MANFGFKSKKTAEKLRDQAHRARLSEQIEYPQPTRMLELYKFTLTAALSGGAGAGATADIEIISSNMTGDTFSDTVVDIVGNYSPLASGTVGLCYRQLGVFAILDAECQQA